MPRSAPPAFHLLAKLTGAACTLDCEYSFFLSKELLSPGSRFHTLEEVSRTYIEQLLASHLPSALHMASKARRTRKADCTEVSDTLRQMVKRVEVKKGECTPMVSVPSVVLS